MRLVHSYFLAKFFFFLQIFSCDSEFNFYTTKYSNLILIFRYWFGLYPSLINPSAEIGQELITWHRIFPPWKQHIQIAKSWRHDFKHIQNISILGSCVLNQWRSISIDFTRTSSKWIYALIDTLHARRCAGSASQALMIIAIERNNGGKFEINPPTPTARFDCIGPTWRRVKTKSCHELNYRHRQRNR